MEPTWSRREFLRWSSAATVGAGLGLARPAAAQPGPEQPPARRNVLLITIDTLRADHLGCYGYGLKTSPTIDALAGQAVVFRNAVAQSTWTLPAVASLLTGQYVGHHGVEYSERRLTDGHLTAARVFGAAGYTTAAVAENEWLTRKFGFDIGFDHFVESECQFPCVQREVTGHAEKWLTRYAAGPQPRKPFFLWLHYFDPHPPYNAPVPYSWLFYKKSDDPFLSQHLELSLSFTLRTYNKAGHWVLPPYSPPGRPGVLAEHDVGYYISQYDAEVRWVDDQLARLFRCLKTLGIFDQSIIVVTADHGECLGEHNIYYERGVPWDPLVKIPLILRVPGMPAGGRAVESQVRQIDILPTLLDLCGLSALTAALTRGHFDGESFAGCLDGQPVQDRIAFGEQGMMQLSYVRLPPWKYIEMKPILNWPAVEEFNREFFRGRDEVRELFNIQDDPAETRNLIETSPKKALEMRLQLLKHKAAMAALKPEAGKAIIDEETRRRLRQLGYLE